VHAKKLSLNTLIAKLTVEPAKILGDKHGKLGTLAVGAEADVTIFDHALEWVVNTEGFVSKGRNTPLAGEKLKGKVIATIYGGKIVFKDEAQRS
jgi:dihydroorotase